jgi:transposase-like protein
VFKNEYKLAILAELDDAKHGQQGVILRRERLYSSQITEWRRQKAAGTLGAPTKRGRKGINPVVAENAELRKRNGELEKRLAISEELNDAQGW